MSKATTGKSRSVLLISLIVAIVGGILMVLSFFLVSVESAALNRSFYTEQYEKLGTAQSVGVSESQLGEATDAVLEYIQNKRLDLNLTAEIDGQTREFFTDQEKQHMVDVANLNNRAMLFLQSFIPLVVFFLVLSYMISDKGFIVLRGCFIGILAALAVFIIIAIWAAVDFNSFWPAFHNSFFTNDLWIMDPAKSLMIRMFSAELFQNLITKIVTFFAIMSGAALAITGVLSWKLSKR